MADEYQDALRTMTTGEQSPATVVEEPVAPAEEPPAVVIPPATDPVQVAAETVAPNALSVISEVTATEQVPTTTAIAEVKPFDETAWLKEKFNVDSIDVLKNRLNTPAPVAPAFEFANEESKQIFNALAAGKESEVYAYLNMKQLATSLADKTPAEIIKAGWKNEYGLTDNEAERKFNKQFGVDELLEDEDKVIEQKLAAKKIEQEVDKYKEYFAKYQQNIKLPSIDTPAPASAGPDYTTEQAKKAITFASELNKGVPVELDKIPFEAADGNLKVKGQIAIPQQELSNIAAQLDGFEETYIEQRYVNPKDGSFNKELFAHDAYFNQNKGVIINTIVSDALRKARIEWMKESRNYQAPGAQVIAGDFTPSEDDVKRQKHREFWG